MLSVLLLLAGLSFVVLKWPQGKHRTFSQHVAQHKSATIYYFFLFAVTLPLLCLFFVRWFTPTFSLSTWVNVWVISSVVFQIACTLVPETTGWRVKVHQALAGVSALLLVPVMDILARSPNIEAVGRILACLSLLSMLSIITYTVQGKHARLLVLQSLYFAAFFVPILYISYVS